MHGRQSHRSDSMVMEHRGGLTIGTLFAVRKAQLSWAVSFLPSSTTQILFEYLYVGWGRPGRRDRMA